MPPSFSPVGGTGTLSVTVARECAWTAGSSAPWIVLTSGREGQGDGVVAYRIDPNADPTTRRGSITVADKTVAVAQDPAPCRFTVTAAQTTAPAAGGDISIDLRTHGACNWTASVNAPWISPSPSAGNGDAVIHARVAANDGGARAADVSIAGERVTISQEPRSAPPSPPPPTPAPPAPAPPPAPCAYQLTSTTATFTAASGAGTFRVRTTAACQWTARSSASWVTVADPVSGTGDRDVRYSVAENFSTARRSAAITVGTETHHVVQDAAQEIDVKGKISGLSGSCPNLRFMVQNRLIATDRDTSFKGGKCSDARNEKEVVVTGVRQSDGSIDASRVEFGK
jgi:uncharacterized protein DUF5666/BACON domain-containing protein/all-beta uncharacterized protein